jgi:hypothetical protein
MSSKSSRFERLIVISPVKNRRFSSHGKFCLFINVNVVRSDFIAWPFKNLLKIDRHMWIFVFLILFLGSKENNVILANHIRMFRLTVCLSINIRSRPHIYWIEQSIKSLNNSITMIVTSKDVVLLSSFES